MPNDNEIVCFVCKGIIPLADDAHWNHKPDCPLHCGNGDIEDQYGCECDLYSHPECCPDCNPPISCEVEVT